MKSGERPEVDRIMVHIPMRLERRGGRKLIIAPDRNAPATKGIERSGLRPCWPRSPFHGILQIGLT